MSAPPFDRIAPAPVLLPGERSASRARAVSASWAEFRPYLGVVTAFWIYVAVSNLMYANNMQASLSAMKVEHVFAPWGARVVQHLVLYPLFVLGMWRSLRIGWTPRWKTYPKQILCALGFAVLAAPALVLGECVTGNWDPIDDQKIHHMDSYTWSGLMPDIRLWAASVTTTLVTYGFGLALVTGFAFYRRLKGAQLRSAALERALTESHLATLRMQLSPHTLFNLLHTIRGQITWDPPAAQAMVVQLGDLLRRLLSAGEREFTRLADELKFVSLYLELQQRRFADRLTVSVSDVEALRGFWVPSLILQPLVENAVVHGLAGHEGPVTIRVEAHIFGETLHLRVLNTIAPDRLTGEAGIGLTNVRERLEVQFGERASFSAGPDAQGIWVAEISIPLLRDGPEGRSRASAVPAP